MQVTDEMVEAALQTYTEHQSSNDLDAMHAALTAALAKAWRPISEAKKDGVPLLVRFRDDLPARVSGFSGKCAVMVWAGRDGGEWHYHGPIGMGGFPDEWIAGWTPLPPEAGER